MSSLLRFIFITSSGSSFSFSVSGSTEHDGFDLGPVLPLMGEVTSNHYKAGEEAHAEAMRRESANYFDGTESAKTYDEILLTEKR